MLAIELVRIMLGISGTFLALIGVSFMIAEAIEQDEPHPIVSRLFLLAIIAFLVMFNI